MISLPTEREMDSFINNVLRIRIAKINKELFSNDVNQSDQWPEITERIKRCQLIKSLGTNPGILPEQTYKDCSRIYHKEIDLLDYVSEMQKQFKTNLEIRLKVKEWHENNPFTFPGEGDFYEMIGKGSDQKETLKNI